MTPIAAFESAWQRCDGLRALYAYIAPQLTSALSADELLRAEWVARVSSLDLYVHELVAQRLLDSIEGSVDSAAGLGKFQLSAETHRTILAALTPTSARAALDLEIRTKLSVLTFQDPDKIADGLRLISDIELWNEIALANGGTPANKVAKAKDLKKQLSAIVQRRNKIAHEADLQPGLPRTPWPIALGDVETVATFIHNIVRTIDRLVSRV